MILTTVAASVRPVSNLQDNLKYCHYQGTVGNMAINDAGFPMDTILREEKVYYPPPAPGSASAPAPAPAPGPASAPGSSDPPPQYVLWFRPGTYTITATIAWTTPVQETGESDAAPHNLLVSMTNALGVQHPDSSITWTEYDFVKVACVATASSTKFNFVTQTLNSVMEVPEGPGSFGAIRFTCVSDAAFPVRPVPVLSAFTARTAVPFLAKPLPLEAPLRSSTKSFSPTPPAALVAVRRTKDLSGAELVWMGSLGLGYTPRSSSRTVTTTSAAFVVPVALFSVFIFFLFVAVVVLLSTQK